MKILADRLELISQAPYAGVGVEVGVYEGSFAIKILELIDPDCLYLVDCWEHQPQEVYNDHANDAQEKQVQRYAKVLRMFQGDARVRVVRAYSEVAAKTFAPNSLDFVYLDANHGEAAIRADLERWYPLIKSGGLFAGHDYCPPELAAFPCGVKPAVDDFVKKLGRELDYMTAEPAHPYQSWGLVKR